MAPTNFSFSEIYSYKNFCNTIPINAKGIYVWGFRFIEHDNLFLPYYVGKHETSIVNRIKEHYNFKDPYNIFHKKYLVEYYKYLKPNNVVKNYTSNEYMKYKKMFAYLNQGNKNSIDGNNGKAINQLTEVIRKSIKLDTDFYQKHFHACCIVVNDKQENYIPNLEQHINFHIPHFLYGRSNAKHNSSFKIDRSNLRDDNFYYNINVKGY